MMIFRNGACAALALGLAVVPPACAPSAAPLPPITCRSVGSGPRTVTTLLVGDSWGTAGRTDLGIAQAMAARYGAARACSLGYSGRRAGTVGRRLGAIPKDYILAATHGVPDHVILVVGINDTVEHTGRYLYAAGARDLIGHARGLGRNVSIVTIPVVDMQHDPSPRSGRIKHFLGRVVFDLGEKEITRSYRSALLTDADVQLIDYDGFIPQYAGHEASYVDGRHLTPSEFGRFGRYIGGQLQAAPQP